MKLQICLLAFLAACTVDAGFCGDTQKRSGWTCDGDESKYCSCKTKKKKTKCEKTQEADCRYGCSKTYSGGNYGRCNLPPTPAPHDEVCATAVVPAKYTATDVCPVVGNSYRTWKNWQGSEPLLDSAMELAEEDIYWWDALRARMVSIDDDTIDITNVTGVEKYAPAMAAAWDKNDNQCQKNVESFSCRRMFPECRKDMGYNVDCDSICATLDKCAQDMYDACLTLPGVAENTTKCYSYADFFSENLDENGKRKCHHFCREYQNDYGGMSGAMSPSLTFAAFITALLAFLF